MSDDDQKVECSVHGRSLATFVCCHLSEGSALGFNPGYDPDRPDAMYPDAWCDDCESVRVAEDGWNERSEQYSDIKLLCSGCYVDARERNWIQDSGSYSELVSNAVANFQPNQDAFISEFRLTEHERWDWDQERGILVFSHEGRPQVEAKIQFSGSFSYKSGTWMWAWANTSLERRVTEHSRMLKESAEHQKYLRLSAGLWPADESDGWQMTAVLAMATNAIGAYRTADEDSAVFMTVTEAKWVKKKLFGFLPRP